MYRIIYKILLLLFAVVGPIVMNGQQSQTIQPGERVVLFCDRTLYITGEQILFSAFLQTGEITNNAESSRVLYCELITPDGNQIAGNKFLFEDSYASGYLKISDDIITGTYYLRAYTRVMRNYGPYFYHYTLIRIINPARKEVQGLTDNNSSSENLNVEINYENTGKSLLISTDKSQYFTRDSVHMSIDEMEKGEAPWRVLSLAVVPEFSISANRVELPESRQFVNSVFYYPETRGLSITGKLEDNTTGDPLPRTLVNLSILGRGRDFMAMDTDSAGRFFFSLPDYAGSRDLFLCVENTGSSDPKILVDNDFCTIPVHIPSGIFTLTRQERETAFNMAVNVQLESYFRIDSIPDAQIDQSEDQAFYGKPDDILYIDDYIQLPTLEEYFNGLPTLAKVRKRKGEKFFRVIGASNEITDIDPLTLVDLVAIDDPSKILSIPPANISRIEVVTGLYVKGDQTYGGIINIISRHGDFAGIDLPSSGVFINYGFLSDSSHYPKIHPPLPHSPDTRNTLCWYPQLVLENGNVAKVSFTTSDTPGRYLIILTGITTGGKTFRQTTAFDVLEH
jgi:hypothetical protein